MTTIAYDGTILAADTQMTMGSHRLDSDTQKIFQPKPGESWYVNGVRAIAFGVAGKLIGVQAVQGALASCMSGYQGLTPHTRFPKGYAISYLVVTETGEVYTGGQYEDDEYPWMAKVATPIAIGSGCEFAIGAMAVGAPADAAVAVASQYDVNTGKTVQSFTFDFTK